MARHATVIRMTSHEYASGALVLIRHGETEWAVAGRHTGRTDVPLTARGEDGARALRPLVAAFRPSLVLASPLQRARRTAELAGLTPNLDDDLVEWDYGGYEGLTSAEIRERSGDPHWTVMQDGVVPGKTPGESIEEVAARAARVIARVAPALADGDVILVAHGHLLRILAATYLRAEPRFAGQLLLGAGALCVLRQDKDGGAIDTWNQRP